MIVGCGCTGLYRSFCEHGVLKYESSRYPAALFWKCYTCLQIYAFPSFGALEMDGTCVSATLADAGAGPAEKGQEPQGDTTACSCNAQTKAGEPVSYLCGSRPFFADSAGRFTLWCR
jgi:hypothetical protein